MSCHQLRKFGSHFSKARCRRLSSERFTLLGMRSYKFMASPTGSAGVPPAQRALHKLVLARNAGETPALPVITSSCNQTAPASACRNSSTRLVDQRRSAVERSSFATPSGDHRFLYPSFPGRRSAVMLPYPLTHRAIAKCVPQSPDESHLPNRDHLARMLSSPPLRPLQYRIGAPTSRGPQQGSPAGLPCCRA